MINVLWKSQWKDLHGASTYLSHHWLVERNISAYDDEELQMWSHLNVVTQFNDNSYATKSESRDYENFTKSVLEEYELNDIEYPYNDAGTFPRAFADTLYVFYELWDAFTRTHSSGYEDWDAVPLINQLSGSFISNFFGEVMAFDENLEQFGKYQVLQFKPEIQKWKQTAIKTMIGECPDCKMSDVQIKDNHRFIEPLDCVGVASNTPPLIEDVYEEYESRESEHFNTATWAGVIGAMIPTMVLVVVGSVLYWIYRKKKYAIVIVRSVSKSRRKPRKTSAEPSSNKSLCKSNSPQDFDPTLQRLETNRMSEELHVQFQVQDSIEDIEEIKPPNLKESKNLLKKNMKVLTSQKSEDSELFEEVCHSLTFDYH